MPLPPRLGRFNRRVTNRITGLFAGWLPGFAILTHKGRRSGHEYHTPINVFRRGEDYYFACTYGPDTDWVKNIFAAGRCEVLTRGRRVALMNPKLLSDPNMRWAPLPVRIVLRLTHVTEYVRMTHT